MLVVRNPETFKATGVLPQCPVCQRNLTRNECRVGITAESRPLFLELFDHCVQLRAPAQSGLAAAAAAPSGVDQLEEDERRALESGHIVRIPILPAQYRRGTHSDSFLPHRLPSSSCSYWVRDRGLVAPLSAGAADLHFDTACAKFYHMSKGAFEVTKVELIVNPTLSQRFADAKQALVAAGEPVQVLCGSWSFASTCLGECVCFMRYE
jgi:hypothetical protein